MKYLCRFRQKHHNKNKVVFSNKNTADSDSLCTSILQPLEPRLLFDAALGAELAAVLSNDVITQAVDPDIINTNQDVSQAIDTIVTDSSDLFSIEGEIDTNTPTNLESNFENYYSYDKSLVKELLFVDSAVDNYAELIEGVDLNKLVAGELEIIILDASSSGIDQISEHLDQYSNQIESVHIVSHGDVAELQLGSDLLNNNSLNNYQDDLSNWGLSFVAGADLLFYGCSVAEGVVGQKFVKDLHDIVEVDIAASSDLTGAAALGGDWELEVIEGDVTAKLAFNSQIQNSYASVLATYTVSTTVDESDGDHTSGDLSFREAIELSNSNSGIDTIVFANAGIGTHLMTIVPPNNVGHTGLPGIAEGVIIDGTSATGYTFGSPVVTLDNSNGGSPFRIDSGVSGVEIRGLNITHNSTNNSNGIQVANNVTDMIIEENVFSNLSNGVLLFGQGTNYDQNVLISENIYNNLSTRPIIIYSTANSFNTTANDNLDTDTGNNYLQNFPDLTGVYLDTSNDEIYVYGGLNSKANTDYRIEFYGKEEATVNDAEYYLGFVDVTTNNSGDVNYTFSTINANASSMVAVGATATNIQTGDVERLSTSEFSEARVSNSVTVDTLSDENNGDTSSISNLAGNPGGSGISLREAIIAANNTAGINAVSFAISGTISIDFALGTLPTITDTLIIDGRTAPGYVDGTPSIKIDSLIPNSTPLIHFQNSGANNSQIYGMEFNANSGGFNPSVFVAGADDVLISNNFFNSISVDNDGVRLTDTDSTIISDNLFDGIKGPAIYSTEGSITNLVIENNEIINGAFDNIWFPNLDANSYGLISNNKIYNNTDEAIEISGSNNVYFDITNNSIYDNADLGIDLGGNGVTANDPNDPDPGANLLQNFPEITYAKTYDNTLDIVGTLNSEASEDYRVDFYANNDSGSAAEGQFFLGSTSVTTGTPTVNDAEFSFNLADLTPFYTAGLNASFSVTSTATKLTNLPAGASGATSEFSSAVDAKAPFIVTNTDDSGAGSLRQAITDANSTVGLDFIIFSTSGTIDLTNGVLPTISETVIIDARTAPGYVAGSPGTPSVVLTGNEAINSKWIEFNGSGASGSAIHGFNFGFIAGGADPAVYVNGADDIVISNNIFDGTNDTGTAGTDGVQIEDTDSTTISNNQFIGNKGYAIFSINGTSLTNLEISDNTITQTIFWTNLFLNIATNSYGTISGNTVFSNAESAFEFDTTNNVYFDISQNSIYDNGSTFRPGISLDSNRFTFSTPQDNNDPDPGANLLQNYPEITYAKIYEDALNVVGTLNSEASEDYRIEFFANNDSGLAAEGQFYLGSITVTTGTPTVNDAEFSFNLADLTPFYTAGLNASFSVTATATKLTNLPAGASGATSEFSSAVDAKAPFIVTNTDDSGAGSLRQAITDANNAVGPDVIIFSTSGTINVGSILPAITDTLILDGSTAPGYTVNNPVVVIGGTLPHNSKIMTIQGTGADYSTVSGLKFNFESGGENPGIYITGASNIIVEDNHFIGTADNDGVGLKNTDSTIIRNNYFLDQRGGAIDGRDGGTITNLLIENNEITGGRAYTLVFSNLSSLSYGLITGNKIYNTGDDSRGDGVSLEGSGNYYFDITNNSIYGNFGEGIDLGAGGVTANDPNDPDPGANLLQNFPEITYAKTYDNTLDIVGTLNSEASEDYRVDFYANNDSGSAAEGQFFLGSTSVTTGTPTVNDAEFSFNLADLTPFYTAGLNASFSVTATATKLTNLPAGASGATSEFSSAVDVTGPFIVSNTDDAGAGSLRQAIIDANSAAGPDIINFSTSGTINLTSVILPIITDTVIIDGSSAPGFSYDAEGKPLPSVYIQDGGTAAHSVFELNGNSASGSVIKGLEISGGDRHNIRIINISNVTIQDNILSNPGLYDNIAVLTGSNLIIENNIMYDAIRTSISVSGISSNGHILNNKIYNTIDGVAPQDSGPIFNNWLIQGNEIYNASGNAISILGSNNEISQNKIYNITGLAIDLDEDGVTSNDPDDVDPGSNDLINFPVITEVLDLGNGTYRIEGYIDSEFTTHNRYRVEFFAGDNTSDIEPKVFVGSVILNNSNSALESDNGSGSVQDRRFIFTTKDLTSSGLTLGDIRFLATTTDVTDKITSEYNAFNAAPIPIEFATVDTLSDGNDGDTSNIAALIATPGTDGVVSLREAIIAANNTPGVSGVYFDNSLSGTINLTDKLPYITSSMIIDASTASGYAVGTPTIELAGTIPTHNDDVFYIVGASASNSIIKGFKFTADLPTGGAYYIEAVGFSNFIATENIFDGAGTNAVNGVAIRGVENATLSNNLFSGIMDRALYIRGSNNILVDNNTFTNNINDVVLINTLDPNMYGTFSNNIIHTNGGRAINIDDTDTTYFNFMNNSIYNNTGIAIDLGNDGDTANDTDDVDPGVNLLQNFPVISSATHDGSNWNIQGTLNSETGETYRLEFFGNATGSSAEGQTYLGSKTVTITDNATPFDASFSVSLAGASNFVNLTATATRTSNLTPGASGATSEFSTPYNTSQIPVLNAVPIAVTSSVNTTEDIAAFVFAMTDFGFTDVDDTQMENIIISTLPSASAGTLKLNGVDVTAGQTISRTNIVNNELTFVPLSNANNTSLGGAPSFTFKVNDGDADSAAAATMTVNIAAVNDAPAATNNNTLNTNEDVSLTLTMADFTFTDVDDTQMENIIISTLPSASAGTLKLNGVDVTAGQTINRTNIVSNELAFVPASNVNNSTLGGAPSFTFKVNDGDDDSANTATMTVNIAVVNDAPVAINNTLSTNEDNNITLTMADFTFTDVDDTQMESIIIDTLPNAQLGTLKLNNVNVVAGQSIGISFINANLLVFEPVAHANNTTLGTAPTFNFTVNDGDANSAVSATMIVDITPVNDAPVAKNNTLTTYEDVNLTFTMANFDFYDVDDTQMESVVINTLPNALVGSLKLDNGITVTNVSSGQVVTKAQIDAGELILDLVPDANSSTLGAAPNFNFTVNDGNANSSNSATMAINVVAVNDAPVAVNVGGATPIEGIEDTVMVLKDSYFNLVDVDGNPLDLVIDTLPTLGSLRLNGVNVNTGQTISNADILANNFVFAPAPDANGTTSFSFYVSDGVLTSASTATFTMDIAAVNDPVSGGSEEELSELAGGGAASVVTTATTATYTGTGAGTVANSSTLNGTGGTGFTPSGGSSSSTSGSSGQGGSSGDTGTTGSEGGDTLSGGDDLSGGDTTTTGTEGGDIIGGGDDLGIGGSAAGGDNFGIGGSGGSSGASGGSSGGIDTSSGSTDSDSGSDSSGSGDGSGEGGTTSTGGSGVGGSSAAGGSNLAAALGGAYGNARQLLDDMGKQMAETIEHQPIASSITAGAGVASGAAIAASQGAITIGAGASATATTATSTAASAASQAAANAAQLGTQQGANVAKMGLRGNMHQANVTKQQMQQQDFNQEQDVETSDACECILCKEANKVGVVK